MVADEIGDLAQRHETDRKRVGARAVAHGIAQGAREPVRQSHARVTRLDEIGLDRTALERNVARGDRDPGRQRRRARRHDRRDHSGDDFRGQRGDVRGIRRRGRRLEHTAVGGEHHVVLEHASEHTE